MGSRRQQVAGVRAGIARQLVNELGISLREVACHLGDLKACIVGEIQILPTGRQRVPPGRHLIQGFITCY
jgi:hypothetical protein